LARALLGPRRRCAPAASSPAWLPTRGRPGRRQRQLGGGLDLLQAQIGHQPLAASGGQRGKDLLQFGDVARDHGEQIVHLARDIVRRDDLRQRPDLLLEESARAKVMTPEGGRDVHLQRKASRGRVKPGADDADDSRLFQPAYPVQGRGWGEPDQAGELDVRAVRVGLQHGEQFDVNFIKVNSHIAIYYCVAAVSQQILARSAATMAL